MEASGLTVRHEPFPHCTGKSLFSLEMESWRMTCRAAAAPKSRPCRPVKLRPGGPSLSWLGKGFAVIRVRPPHHG